MKLFSGSSNKPLAEKIAKDLKIEVSPIELHVFPDGEQRVMLEVPVIGKDTVVVQSTGIPTDNNYMELFFIIDALRRSGAKSITVVIPYVGYQRQDHVFRDGEARSLEVVIRFMETAGTTKFVGVDFHTIKVPQIFLKPVVDLSALPLFAEEIQKLGFTKEDTVLVTPDMGGIRRIKILSELLDGMEYVSVEKNRDLVTGELNVEVMHGEVKKRAVIVDDMISSGGTIVKACELLEKKGVEETYVMATHAVFSGEAPKLLQDSKAKKVYVTDTIFVPKEKEFEKLQILSMAPEIAKALK
jgi:ribose-phosphate pyrophosphokinase